MKSIIKNLLLIILLLPSLMIYGRSTNSDPIDSLINTVKGQISRNSNSGSQQGIYLINFSNQNVSPGIYTNFVNSGSSIWSLNTAETQTINNKISSIQPLLNGAKYYIIVASIYNYADLEDVESFSNNHDWNTVGTVLHKGRTETNSSVAYRYDNTMNGGAKPNDVEASQIISRSILKKLNRESFGDKVYLQFFITCYTYNKKNKVGSKYTISHTMLGSLSKDILGTPQFRELHFALRSSENAKAFANCTTPELRKRWLNGWLDVVYDYLQKNKPQLTPGADALSGKQLNFSGSVIDGTVRNSTTRAFSETELNTIRTIIDDANKYSNTKFKTVIVNEDDPEFAKIKEQAIKSANKPGEEAFIVFAKRKPNELLEFFEYIVPDAWKREGPQYNDGCNTEVFTKANAAMQQYLSLRPGNKAEAYLYGTYKLIFESLKCMFSESNCGSSSAFSFVCGAFSAAVESVDVIGGIEGLAELAAEAAKGAIKNRIEFVRDVWDLTRNFNKYAAAWPGNIEEIVEKIRPPYIRDVTGVSQFVKKTFDHLKTYFVTDGNMYRYGQATVYVGTIVFMVGKPLLNLIPKLRAAKLGANVEVVVNTIHEAEKAGKVIVKSGDDIIIYSENEFAKIKEAKSSDPNIESTWTKETSVAEHSITSNFEISVIKQLTERTPSGSNLTKLHKTEFISHGYRYKPTSGNMKSIIDDIIANGDLNGNKTESIVNQLMQDNGYILQNGKYGSNNGYDGIFIKGTLDNPTEIIVLESKQFKYIKDAADDLVEHNGVVLNSPSTTTSLPAQMSDAWINYVATKIEGVNPELSMAIQLHFDKVQKYVVAVDKTKGELNVLKLANY